MDSSTPKVQCQAALALRNLASDEKYQLEIVRAKGLPPLLRLLQSSYLPLILSAVACIRNISIHPLNESPIIDAGFLKPLVDLLGSTDNEEIQCHAISTLRNLAASSDRNKELVLQAGAVQKCKDLVLRVPLSVQSEMTAAIAVLALSDELKPHLLNLGVFDVLIPLTNSESIEVQGNSAAALGNLSSKVRHQLSLYYSHNCASTNKHQLAITRSSFVTGLTPTAAFTVISKGSLQAVTLPSNTLPSGLFFNCWNRRTSGSSATYPNLMILYRWSKRSLTRTSNQTKRMGRMVRPRSLRWHGDVSVYSETVQNRLLSKANALLSHNCHHP